MLSFDYRAPRSLRQALRLLADANGQAKLLAGGTDLLVQMKNGQASPRLVVDVKDIPELQRLELRPSRGLYIGAAVPLATLLEQPALAEGYPILAQACSQLGSPQVRNRGTLGGNLCNASPAANTATPLLCLGARAIIAGPGGRRRVPLEDFFLGPGKTAVGDDELLVAVFIPQPRGRALGRYLQFTPREEMDIPVVNVCCLLTLGRGARCRRARVALGAVAPISFRARAVEARLEGQRLDEKAIEEAVSLAAQEARPIDDVRASAEYRRELVKVLVRRALRAIIDEASRI